MSAFFQAAIWTRLVTPAACSFFSSAGPTPPMSLMSSVKSAAGLAAAFLAAGALVSVAASALSALGAALGAAAFLAGLASVTDSVLATTPTALMVGLAPPVRISVMRTVDSNWRWPLRRR